MFLKLVALLLGIAYASCQEYVQSVDSDIEDHQPCLDHNGKKVSHGDRFRPSGSDPCTVCTCLNGEPQMCITAFCSPPENCRQYHALSDKCCEFVCLDRDFPNKAPGNVTYPGKDAITCVVPLPPVHGSVLLPDGPKVGMKAFYSCDDGRTLVGRYVSECLITGEWSSPQPECLST